MERPQGHQYGGPTRRAQEAKKALLERFRSAAQDRAIKVYEEQQAKLREVAEARRQREEERARQKAARKRRGAPNSSPEGRA